MMLLCIKQHLFQFMKKLRNTEAELKKRVAYKKVCSLGRSISHFI